MSRVSPPGDDPLRGTDPIRVARPRSGVVSPGAALILGVVSDPGGLDRLRDEWVLLLASSRSDNLFLTWEWVSTWWRIYGTPGELYVVTVRSEDGVLRGLAPLQRIMRLSWRRSRYTIRFIGFGGDVTPEYLDFIVQQGWELEATHAIIAHLLSDRSVLEIDLLPFASDSQNLPELHKALRDAPGVTHLAPLSWCPTLRLPETQQEFMATRSANYRKKLGECQRRCQRRFDASLRLALTADDVRSDLKTLQKLHRARWGSRSRAFQSSRYTAFHRDFAVLAHERGWLRLYSLDGRQRTMAILYCFLYRGRYYFYQAARDPQFAKERVGLLLMHLVIQQAIAERAQIFDFLSGREAYKFRWAESETQSDRLVYWRNRAAQASSLCRQAFAMVGSLSTGGRPDEG